MSNRNLVLFLTERKIISIKEMVELSVQYNEANSVSDASFRQSLTNRTDTRSGTFRKDSLKGPLQMIIDTQRSLDIVTVMGVGKRTTLSEVVLLEISQVLGQTQRRPV